MIMKNAIINLLNTVTKRIFNCFISINFLILVDMIGFVYFNNNAEAFNNTLVWASYENI